jgi:hypothetical protein
VKEEAEEILETLDEAHERLEELKKERKKLLKANKKLVKVLVDMEEVLEQQDIEVDQMGDYSYDFHRGWNDHREELNIEDFSEDSIDRQLRQLDSLLKDLEVL